MSTQDTFINIHRGPDGQIQVAELFSGFSFLPEEAVLLDIFHIESEANTGEFVPGSEPEEDDTFSDGEGKIITIQGRRPVSELIASWITNPPAEPTEAVRWHSVWETHIQQEIDIALGK